MGYNEKGHKEPLVVRGAGERPAKSSLTSPVYVFPDCAPLWRAVVHLAYQYSVPRLLVCAVCVLEQGPKAENNLYRTAPYVK
jgi:hypothetical protein